MSERRDMSAVRNLGWTERTGALCDPPRNLRAALPPSQPLRPGRAGTGAIARDIAVVKPKHFCFTRAIGKNPYMTVPGSTLVAQATRRATGSPPYGLQPKITPLAALPAAVSASKRTFCFAPAATTTFI